MKRASDILARLIEQKADEQARSGSGVFRSWEQIAGSPLSDHSRVYELQHDQLCVEVDHPGWLQMLLLRKKQILHRVSRAYPQLKIRGLRARVNPRFAETPPTPEVPAAAAASTAAPAPPEASARDEQVEQAVSAAGSEDLKARLRRLFQTSLRRKPPGSTTSPRG